MEEQKKGNSYEVKLLIREMEQTKLCSTLVWGNKGREIVMKYSCKRRKMEQTKLCSTLVWRNRRREIVMKYSC